MMIKAGAIGAGLLLSLLSAATFTDAAAASDPAPMDLPKMKPGRYQETMKIVSARNLPKEYMERAKHAPNARRRFCYAPVNNASSQGQSSIVDQYEDNCSVKSAIKAGETHRITLQCIEPTGGINMVGRFAEQTATITMEMWLAPSAPGEERGTAQVEAQWERIGDCQAD